jgi:hypothetical protein
MKGAKKYVDDISVDMFGFGPSADGQFVRQLAALELATGNFAKSIESLIVSHVPNEATMFVHGQPNNTIFRGYQEYIYGNNIVLTDAIAERFPLPSPNQKYQNNNDRFAAMLQLTSFTCNTRWITEAYKGKTWNVQYSAGGGFHGSDVGATFYGSPNTMDSIVSTMLGGLGIGAELKQIGPVYQSYLISHARTGDPNQLKEKSAMVWPKVSQGPLFSNVLNVARPFSLITDNVNSAEDCDFFLDVFSSATNVGGYAPPGAILPSKLINFTGNASGNFIIS